MKCPKKDPSFFNKNLKKIMTLQNIITTPPPPHPTPSVFLVYGYLPMVWPLLVCANTKKGQHRKEMATKPKLTFD